MKKQNFVKKRILIALAAIAGVLAVIMAIMLFSSKPTPVNAPAVVETITQETETDNTKNIEEETPAKEVVSTEQQSNSDSEVQAEKWPKEIANSDAQDIGVLVNKKFKLRSDYYPSVVATGLTGGGELRQEAVVALSQLFSAANNEGISLSVLSAYRSYSTQESTYNGYVSQYGQEQTDTFSARPGHSEHQTGLAVDVGTGECNFDQCFGGTIAGKWLQLHAPEYGFIIRYPSDGQELTGYSYEPWHLRYLGKDIAKAVVAGGGVYEKYLGKPGGNY